MENSTENINQGRPVYFSYARNSNKKPEWEHISDCVDTLLETLKAQNLEYRLDVRDIGMGDKISKFEEEIGWNSEVVVIIFSDKYFRSSHCMYEFVQIKNALKQYPEKRLMCIKSGDFNLADFNYIMELEDFWNDKKKEYEKIEFHHLREHSGTEIAAHDNGFYLEDVRKLYSFFSAINYSNTASINYDGFVGDIVKYYKTTRKPKLTPKPRVQQLTKTEQRTSSTSQPTTKTSPIVPIAIAAVVVVAIAIYLMAGKITSTKQSTTTDNSQDVSIEQSISIDNSLTAETSEQEVTSAEQNATTDDSDNVVTTVATYRVDFDDLDFNLEEGKRFLKDNAKKNGVKTLPNGVQYIVLEEGKGEKPTIDDEVEIDYEVSLIDGTKIDSSIERGEPAKFPLKALIKGWAETIPLMPVGSKWKIFIPSELAYGEHSSGPIPGNSVMIADVKLYKTIK